MLRNRDKRIQILYKFLKSRMMLLMRIQQLKLTTFRNVVYAEVAIKPAKKGQIVALIGPNGAGKTSVLEALSLLSPGRGVHKAKAEHMIQNGEKSWGIYVSLDGGRTVGQQFQKGKRALKVDNNLVERQGQLAELGNVLWLVPRMDRLFLDGAAARRDFIDRMVFGINPSHAEVINKYKHHLSARLKLLKRGNDDVDWLDIEEQQAAKFGIKILQARQAYLKKLSPCLTDVTLTLSGATLAVLQEENPIAALANKFKRSRARDAEVGATHTGAQKVDITGFLNLEESPISLEQVSSGQHKRALVDITLAHAKLVKNETGVAPLVLIDEVGAHLDAERRAYVLDALLNLGAQVWVSEVDKTMFENMLAHIIFINMADGVLTTLNKTV